MKQIIINLIVKDLYFISQSRGNITIEEVEYVWNSNVYKYTTFTGKREPQGMKKLYAEVIERLKAKKGFINAYDIAPAFEGILEK